MSMDEIRAALEETREAAGAIDGHIVSTFEPHIRRLTRNQVLVLKTLAGYPESYDELAADVEMGAKVRRWIAFLEEHGRDIVRMINALPGKDSEPGEVERPGS